MCLLTTVSTLALRKAARTGLVIAPLVAVGARAAAQVTAPLSYEFIGGHWFDGTTFVEKHFYSVDGLLTSERPGRVDSVIDLNGKYVVPPFGEAHNHNVEAYQAEAISRRYLGAGIFYVKNPNNMPRERLDAGGMLNTPTTIDVVFANGGLTAPDGHPLGLVRRNIARGIWTEADGEGQFVHTLHDETDLDRKWDMIKAQQPDFLKTYLLYSEEYEQRKNDTAFFAWKGLNPDLLPTIVRRAHRDGLRVSTHVETAADFHHAILAGVDEVNHLPGFRPRPPRLRAEWFGTYEIAASDARLAADHGTVVVTTIGALIERLQGADSSSPEGAIAERTLELTKQNLQVLKEHGVRIALGTDGYEHADASEAMNLYRLGVFDNLELLKMWAEVTPATIFPERKIGRLEDGYEASFLVLSGDPLEDFSNTQKIELRVKQGVVLK